MAISVGGEGVEAAAEFGTVDERDQAVRGPASFGITALGEFAERRSGRHASGQQPGGGFGRSEKASLLRSLI